MASAQILKLKYMIEKMERPLNISKLFPNLNINILCLFFFVISLKRLEKGNQAALKDIQLLMFFLEFLRLILIFNVSYKLASAPFFCHRLEAARGRQSSRPQRAQQCKLKACAGIQFPSTFFQLRFGHCHL